MNKSTLSLVNAKSSLSNLTLLGVTKRKLIHITNYTTTLLAVYKSIIFALRDS